MTFPQIPNILGNAGSGVQALPDLTAGLRGVQQTDINRRLRQQEQERAEAKQKEARDEEFMLKMQTVDFVDDLRVSYAEQAAKDAQSYLDEVSSTWQRAKASGKGLSIEDQVKIFNEQKKILSNNAKAQSFIKALDSGRGSAIAVRNNLKDPEQIADFDAKWANLYRDINDPEKSKDLSSYSVMEALQPPPPTANMVVGDWTTKLVPLVDSAVYVGADGSKRVDETKLKESISANIGTDQYGMQTVAQKYGFTSPQEVVDLMADRVRSSIGITAGRAGDGSGAEKDKAYSFTPSDKIGTLWGGETPGARLNFKQPINLAYNTKEKDEKGKDKVIFAKFKPNQIVEGEDESSIIVEGDLNLKKGDVVPLTSIDLATIDKLGGSVTKATPTGKKGADKLPIFNYEIESDITITHTVEYDKVKEDMEAKIPELSAYVAKLKSGLSGGNQKLTNKTFTIQGYPYTYDELKGGGWTDEQIQQLNQQ
jgi:hypothetical protein